MNGEVGNMAMSADLGNARPGGAEQALYRLRDGTAKVGRRNGLVLVSPESGAAVRISPIANELMPLLVSGARFDELLARLECRHPGARDTAPKLEGFLAQLERSGLLEHSAAAAPRRVVRGRRWEIGSPDRLAAALARVLALVPRPLRGILWGSIIAASVAGIALLAARGALPHPSVLVVEFSALGLAVFCLVVVPLHELAHAVACRLAGARVGVAGIIFHGGLVPGPYVDTSDAYKVADRRKRASIPAAGPLTNLAAAGAAAWALIALAEPGEPLAQMLAFVLVASLVFVYLDSNPLAPTDGSHVLEALLDDELARRSALSRKRARLSHWRSVALYRIACSLHLQTSAVLGWLWWTQTAG